MDVIKAKFGRSLLCNAPVPDELISILEDLYLMYLEERPKDPIDFAYKYFITLKNTKFAPLVLPPDDEDEDEDENIKVKKYKSRMEIYVDDQRRSESVEPTNISISSMIIYPKSDVQKKKLMASLDKILIFRKLTEEEKNIIISVLNPIYVQEGNRIICQGDEADYFYIIEQGVFAAYKSERGDEPKLVRAYYDEGSFGELALMYNRPRAATVVAITDGLLYTLDKTIFRKFVPLVDLERHARHDELIKSLQIFDHLDEYDRIQLLNNVEERQYQNGELIFKEGDIADGMYVVSEGSVVIFLQNPGGFPVVLETIVRGGYMGELALIMHSRRAASARAYGKTTALFIHAKIFDAVLGPCAGQMKRNIDRYEGRMFAALFRKVDHYRSLGSFRVSRCANGFIPPVFEQ